MLSFLFLRVKAITLQRKTACFVTNLLTKHAVFPFFYITQKSPTLEKGFYSPTAAFNPRSRQSVHRHRFPRSE